MEARLLEGRPGMSFSLGRDYHSAPVLGSDPEVARALLELGRARHLNVPEKPETVGQNGAKVSQGNVICRVFCFSPFSFFFFFFFFFFLVFWSLLT